MFIVKLGFSPAPTLRFVLITFSFLRRINPSLTIYYHLLYHMATTRALGRVTRSCSRGRAYLLSPIPSLASRPLTMPYGQITRTITSWSYNNHQSFGSRVNSRGKAQVLLEGSFPHILSLLSPSLFLLFLPFPR